MVVDVLLLLLLLLKRSVMGTTIPDR